MIRVPHMVEFSEEQRLRVRVRVPSVGRTEYEEEGSFAAVGCLSYSYSAQWYSYSTAVPGCSCFLGVSSPLGEPSMVIEELNMVEGSEEQRLRVPSARRTEYEDLTYFVFHPPGLQLSQEIS